MLMSTFLLHADGCQNIKIPKHIRAYVKIFTLSRSDSVNTEHDFKNRKRYDAEKKGCQTFRLGISLEVKTMNGTAVKMSCKGGPAYVIAHALFRPYWFFFLPSSFERTRKSAENVFGA